MGYDGFDNFLMATGMLAFGGGFDSALLQVRARKGWANDNFKGHAVHS